VELHDDEREMYKDVGVWIM